MPLPRWIKEYIVKKINSGKSMGTAIGTNQLFILIVYILQVGFFCYVLSWLLVRRPQIEALGKYAWQAFAITLPVALISSWILVDESLILFGRHVALAAIVLFGAHLARWLIPFFPSSTRPIANFIGALVDDFFAVLAFLLLFRSWCRRHTPQTPMGGNGIPILMIHGYRHDASAWILHRPRLAEEGFGPLFVIDLGSVYHTIEEYGEHVKQKAEDIAKQTGKSDLILIGVSMGGLVAAHYALHLAPLHTVKGMITLGTPFHGTRMAIFGNGPCAKQMRYGSPFVMNLSREVATCTAFPFYHISTLSDTIVRPVSSARLNGESSYNIQFEDLGHLSLLYSDRIADCLSRLVRVLEAS
jgi:triacylglycerol lipase